MSNVRFALYLAGSLLVGLSAREYARAFTAARLHDPTPRLWGRLTFSPKVWFEPFGSGLLPALILLLWACRGGVPPATGRVREAGARRPQLLPRTARGTRSSVSLAGPIANLALAAVGGLVLRAGIVGEVGLVALAFMLANLSLLVFHLLPIPGLDGARMVALVLPPRAAEVYRNADQYLPLFVLVVLFLFAGPLISIVQLAHGLALPAPRRVLPCPPL